MTPNVWRALTAAALSLTFALPVQTQNYPAVQLRALLAADSAAEAQRMLAADRATILPLLQKSKQESSPSDPIFRTARRVLARDGDYLSLLEIVVDLYSSNGQTHNFARQGLRYAGGQTAFRVFRGMLDDSVGPMADHDLFYSPRTQAAMQSLSNMAPSPPFSAIEATIRFRQALVGWKAYLDAHPDLWVVESNRYDWKAALRDPRVRNARQLVLALGRVLDASYIGDILVERNTAVIGNATVLESFDLVLAKLGHPPSEQLFLTRFRTSTNLAVREATVSGLGYIGSGKAFDQLLNFVLQPRSRGVSNDSLLLKVLQTLPTMSALAPTYPKDGASIPAAVDAWRKWNSQR